MLSRRGNRHMDILKELDNKDERLAICYSIIQLQIQEISKLTEQVKHLEQLLMHKAELIDKE